MTSIKRFRDQTENSTRIYPFQCSNALLEKADVVACLNHQSLASFVRQCVAAGVESSKHYATGRSQ